MHHSVIELEYKTNVMPNERFLTSNTAVHYLMTIQSYSVDVSVHRISCDINCQIMYCV